MTFSSGLNNLYLADRIGYRFGNIQTITAIVNTKDINGNNVQQEVSQRFAFRKVATEVNGIPTGYTSAAVEALAITEPSNVLKNSALTSRIQKKFVPLRQKNAKTARLWQ